MKKVLYIFGTRPEGIKVAPIINKMKKNTKNFKVIVCSTGQHAEMLDQVMEFFDVDPDYKLNVMKPNQSLYKLTSGILERLERVLVATCPDLVIVQGDTTTAFIGALAAYYKQIPVAHVEAGLRSYDLYSPFPEEGNRLLISKIASYHFAPTNQALEALLSEGVRKDRIFLTGNTVTDAIIDARNIISSSNELKKKFAHIVNKGNKIILVTAHRRESFGGGIDRICQAVKKLVELRKDIEIVFPVHLNPNVQKVVFGTLDNMDRVHLIPPLDYSEMVYMMSLSYIVMTDSGGIQEEAPTLGKPVLVLRSVTERMEGVRGGTAILVGTDKAKILSNAIDLLDNIGGDLHENGTCFKPVWRW